MRRQEVEIDDQKDIHDVTSLSDEAEEYISTGMSTMQITHQGFIETDKADNLQDLTAGYKNVAFVTKRASAINVGDFAMFGRAFLQKGYTVKVTRKEIVGLEGGYESSKLHYGEVALTPSVSTRSFDLSNTGLSNLTVQVMIENAVSDQQYRIQIDSIEADGTKHIVYQHETQFTNSYGFTRYITGQVDIPAASTQLSITATKLSGSGPGDLYAFADIEMATNVLSPININMGSGNVHGNPFHNDVLEFRKGTSTTSVISFNAISYNQLTGPEQTTLTRGIITSIDLPTNEPAGVYAIVAWPSNPGFRPSRVVIGGIDQTGAWTFGVSGGYGYVVSQNRLVAAGGIIEVTVHIY